MGGVGVDGENGSEISGGAGCDIIFAACASANIAENPSCKPDGLSVTIEQYGCKNESRNKPNF